LSALNETLSEEQLKKVKEEFGVDCASQEIFERLNVQKCVTV
jgi:uncharacterized protein YpuA (DUF1002 family)